MNNALRLVGVCWYECAKDNAKNTATYWRGKIALLFANFNGSQPANH